MKYVVKLGGAGLEVPALLDACVRAITELVRDGNHVAVVHGGGVQLTRTLKALGKQSEFINGLRVTDAETRDTALMVLAGKVNKSLVAALGALGQPAVGMSGGDGLMFRARRKRTAPDLGFVGEIAASDARWLDAIWQLTACRCFAPWRSASTANTTTLMRTKWRQHAPSPAMQTRLCF
jgi:acetylglutamate kinase